MTLNNGFVKTSAVLGVVPTLLILICMALPYWRVSDVLASEPNMRQIDTKEGLWIRCTSYTHQYWNCDTYDTALIGLPAYLNSFRALMVIAFLASLSGLVVSCLGMNCSNLLAQGSRTKRLVVIGGGFGHILAGVLTGVCVSWYAGEVVREFNSDIFQNRKLRFTLGACLYLGWVAAPFSLLCGSLMACCHMCRVDRNDDDFYRVPSKPSSDFNTQAVYNRDYTVALPKYDEKEQSSPYEHRHRSSTPPHRHHHHHGSSRHSSSRHSDHHHHHRNSPGSTASSRTEQPDGYV